MSPDEPQTLRVAVAQPFCAPGDLDANLAAMDRLLARRDGAQIVLFPEAGVTGYRVGLPEVTLGDATCDRLHEMATCHDTVIAAGFLERNGEHVHITHAAFHPGGGFDFQRKARPGPPEGDMPDWQAGPDERHVFEVAGVRCAMSICADVGIVDHWDTVAKLGVRLHLVPTAGLGPRSAGFSLEQLEDPATFDEYLKKAESVIFSPDAIRQCRQHGVALACANQLADDGVDYFHCGHAMIVDATGELAALIPGSFVFEHLRERIAVATLRLPPPRHEMR